MRKEPVPSSEIAVWMLRLSVDAVPAHKRCAMAASATLRRAAGVCVLLLACATAVAAASAASPGEYVVAVPDGVDAGAVKEVHLVVRAHRVMAAVSDKSLRLARACWLCVYVCVCVCPSFGCVCVRLTSLLCPRALTLQMSNHLDVGFNTHWCTTDGPFAYQGAQCCAAAPIPC